MMHVILRDGLEDRDYIAQNTHGIEQLTERVREYTPERVATWTGMTPAQIEQLAREYATTQPAALRMNYGVQRSENGGTTARAYCHAARPHRCMEVSWRRRLAFDLRRLLVEPARTGAPRPGSRFPIGRAARIVNMSTLGQALTELGQGPDAKPEDGPAVHALFVYNSNPGAVAPNQNAVRRGMTRPDLFTVVHEQFFNDTTDFADYVLPATTFLEHTDIQGAYGHYFVQLSNQAIQPPGEARSNIWLFGQLAQYMGFPEPCFRDTEEQMIRQALAVGLDGHSTNAGMEHISFEDLKEQGHIPLAFHRDPEAHPFMPYTSGTVPTPSGKIEFYSQTLASKGLDPLPAFVPPTESRWGIRADRFPLEFLSRKADNYMNSTFANLDGHRKMESKTSQRLEMHPIDAKARGIANGDKVRIWNDRGSLELTAMVDGTLPAGVVAARLDWSKFHPEGSNVNALTSERLNRPWCRGHLLFRAGRSSQNVNGPPSVERP
jgi:anaerobic selenocysteine-containing dehydrogenase